MSIDLFCRAPSCASPAVCGSSCERHLPSPETEAAIVAAARRFFDDYVRTRHDRAFPWMPQDLLTALVEDYDARHVVARPAFDPCLCGHGVALHDYRGCIPGCPCDAFRPVAALPSTDGVA